MTTRRILKAGALCAARGYNGRHHRAAQRPTFRPAPARSQHGHTVYFDIERPRPGRNMQKDAGWRIDGKIPRVDCIELAKCASSGVQ